MQCLLWVDMSNKNIRDAWLPIGSQISLHLAQWHNWSGWSTFPICWTTRLFAGLNTPNLVHPSEPRPAYNVSYHRHLHSQEPLSLCNGKQSPSFSLSSALCFVIFLLNSLIGFPLPCLSKGVSYLMGDRMCKKKGHKFACFPSQNETLKPVKRANQNVILKKMDSTHQSFCK